MSNLLICEHFNLKYSLCDTYLSSLAPNNYHDSFYRFAYSTVRRIFYGKIKGSLSWLIRTHQLRYNQLLLVLFPCAVSSTAAFHSTSFPTAIHFTDIPANKQSLIKFD